MLEWQVHILIVVFIRRCLLLTRLRVLYQNLYPISPRLEINRTHALLRQVACFNRGHQIGALLGDLDQAIVHEICHIIIVELAIIS